MVGRLAEEHARRARPGDQSRAAHRRRHPRRPAPRGRDAGRTRPARGRCARRRPAPRGSPLARAARISSGRVGHLRRIGPEVVVVAVDGRRGHPLGRRHDHPPPRAAVGQRGHDALRGPRPARCRRAARTARRSPAAPRASAGRGRRCRGRASRSSATSAAAPSAEPPARPPAIGIDLSTRTTAADRTGRAASLRYAAARSTMLWPGGGRWLGVEVRRHLGLDDQVVGRRHGDVVVQADRLVDGDQGVEAVGARGRRPPAAG